MSKQLFLTKVKKLNLERISYFFLLVNLSRAGEGHLKAELISPDTSTVACRCYIHELNRFEYLIEYIPNEPGRYQLRILFNNQLYQNKSIDIDVYSLLPNVKSTVEIQQISPKHVPIVIGEEICLKIISIDKRIIYAQITCNDSSVPCKIQQVNQSNIWFLKFRPYLIGNHLIQLTHNGQTLMSKQRFHSNKLIYSFFSRFTLRH